MAEGSELDSGSVVKSASGCDDEFVGDTTELAPKGSPKLKSDVKPPVPVSVLGESIGESGNGVCVGERGVVSVTGNGVGAFVDIGVLSSVDGFDTSPIPKDKEARNLSSNRDRGLLESCTPPPAVPLVLARAGLDGRWACKDLRILERAESASWPEDGRPPSPEFVRDMIFEVSLSWEEERRIGCAARCSTAFRNWENMLRGESLDALI